MITLLQNGRPILFEVEQLPALPHIGLQAPLGGGRLRRRHPLRRGEEPQGPQGRPQRLQHILQVRAAFKRKCLQPYRIGGLVWGSYFCFTSTRRDLLRGISNWQHPVLVLRDVPFLDLQVRHIIHSLGKQRVRLWKRLMFSFPCNNHFHIAVHLGVCLLGGGECGTGPSSVFPQDGRADADQRADGRTARLWWWGRRTPNDDNDGETSDDRRSRG